MNHYKNNLLEELHRLTEAVQASHADIAPTYLEYTQLAFAIATDCGEAGRADFMSLCSLSPKHDSAAAEKLFSNALHTCVPPGGNVRSESRPLSQKRRRRRSRRRSFFLTHVRAI